jgi:hypothetical protein
LLLKSGKNSFKIFTFVSVLFEISGFIPFIKIISIYITRIKNIDIITGATRQNIILLCLRFPLDNHLYTENDFTTIVCWEAYPNNSSKLV